MARFRSIRTSFFYYKKLIASNGADTASDNIVVE